MKNTTIYECPIIRLQTITNRAGNITVVSNTLNIPFQIKRVYYLYDIPAGQSRGGHAHRHLYQLIVAASGSFSIILDDGDNKKVIMLNRPDFGLLIVPGIWRELLEFSSGSVCLVLASEKYNERDYIRDYDLFKKLKKKT